MKKKVLMIVMIVLVILLIPRNSPNGQSFLHTHGHQHPMRKLPQEQDDFELPTPSNWLLLTGEAKSKTNAPGALYTGIIALCYNKKMYGPLQVA